MHAIWDTFLENRELFKDWSFLPSQFFSKGFQNCRRESRHPALKFKPCISMFRVHPRQGLLGAPPRLPFWWQISALLPFDLIEHPDTRKCSPTKKNYKIKLHALLKLSSQLANFTICELWQFFKNHKRKQSFDLYVWDDRTPIQYVIPFQ